MYLVAHQDDCQMVTGIESDTDQRMAHDGTEILVMRPYLAYPRQCTCEPKAVNLEVLLRMIGGVRHKMSDLYL